MLEMLFSFPQLLYIVELIKVSEDTHNFRKSMHLHNIEEFKGFLRVKQIKRQFTYQTLVVYHKKRPNSDLVYIIKILHKTK